MRRSRAGTPTLKLATARLEFSGDRRITQALHVIAVAALVFLVVAIGRQLHADSEASGAAMQALEQQNAALRTDLARTRTELDLERSTRAALARQVAQLNDETSELQSRLAFFSAQSGRPSKTR
jgi:septal ring factor EnvC (AmiA/AmiB activator)